MAQRGLHMYFHDREFNRAIDQLADMSKRGDVEVLTGQAIQLVRALVRFTRLTVQKKRAHRGRARAGWWPAWVRLGVFAVPQGASKSALGLAEGEFVDGRGNASEPFVEMTNEVSYINTLDKKDNILTQAFAARFDDMQRALDRKYKQMLRSKSAFK